MYHVITERIKFRRSDLLKFLSDVGKTEDNINWLCYDHEMNECSVGSEKTISHFCSYDSAVCNFEEEARKCFTVRGVYHYTVVIIRLIKADLYGLELFDYEECKKMNSLINDLMLKGDIE